MNTFAYPIMQSLAMFAGMAAVLPLHWAIVAFKIPFPGYDHCSNSQGSISISMYFYMAIPAVFDVVSTVADKYGLMLLPVSVFQMLKGKSLDFFCNISQPMHQRIDQSVYAVFQKYCIDLRRLITVCD